MKNIKLLSLDLDGTVVYDNKYASQKDICAIKNAVKAGVFVTIATGRMYYSAKKWADEFGTNAPLLTCNGSRIRDEKKVYYSNSIEESKLKDLFEVFDDMLVRRYCFGRDAIFCTPEGVDESFFTKNNTYKNEGPFIKVLENKKALFDEIGGDTNKFLVIMKDENDHKKALERVKSISGFESVVGDLHNIEFTNAGVTKAAGFKTLADMLGVDMESTMAIGDSENDIEIIKASGLGVAVDNAMENVKEIADEIVGSISESGVAQAIEKFILKK